MEENTHKVILYNDDHNSFPYVMACLIRFCDHYPMQAEQCALLVHLSGKCAIKHGNYLDMFELSESLSNLDLKSSVEAHESHMY